jgi:hypothetical protein
MFVEDFRTFFAQYRSLGERTLAQMSDEALNALPETEANSPAMLVRHISGNLTSRFTDFLTSDGEKPWRQRDREFEAQTYTREEVERWWHDAFTVVDHQLGNLTDADLTRTVTIGNESMTAHAALTRSLTHFASHVGQLVLLGRMHAGSEWKWLSIPKAKAARVRGPRRHPE